MKKPIIFILYLFVLTQSVISQDRVKFEDLYLYVGNEEARSLDDFYARGIDLHRGLVYYQNNLFTGVGFDKNSGKREIITFKNGKRHGKSIGWWENGNKNFQENFRDGESHGMYYTWFEDMHPKASGEYVFSYRHGEHKRWCHVAYKDEYNLIESINYKNGKLHGSYQKWSCTGRIRERKNYLNGEKDGVQIDYYYDGQIEERTNYVNGKKHGNSEAFYEDGEIKWIRVYEYGERVE